MRALSSSRLSSLVVLNVLVLTLGVAAFTMPALLTASHLALGGLVIAYLVAVWHRCSAHPDDLLEMDTVFLAFFGIYVVVPIIAFLVWEELGDAPPFVELVTRFDTGVIAVALVALGGFLWGYSSVIGPALSRLAPSADGRWTRGEGLAVSGGLVTVGAALLTALVGSVGLETLTESGYAHIYEATAGLGVLAGGVMLIEVWLVVLYLTLARRGGRAPLLPLILFAVLALLMLRLGRRRVVLETGMALLVAHHFHVRKIRVRTLALGGAAALLVFSVIGLARAYLAEGLGGIVEHVVEEFGFGEVIRLLAEPVTVLLALTETMYQVPGQEPFWLGRSYLEAFEILIPLPLHPARPLAPSQWFVNLIDPAVAAAGGGYAYALLAEGYLNFGLLGVLAASFLEGVVVRGAVAFRRRVPESKSRILVYAIVVSLTVMMIRGDFATLLKVGIVSSILPAGLIAAWLGRRPRPASLTPEVVRSEP